MNRAFARSLMGCFCVFWLGGSAAAQDDEAGTAGAIAALDSTDRPALARAFETLGRLEHAPAIAPISRRIRRGLPPGLLVAAVRALGAIQQPEAGPVLLDLCRYRRPEVRVAAIEALVATQPPEAAGALAGALEDPSALVRGAAATGLGDLGDASTLDALITALGAGVPEAGPVVGRLVDAERVPRVLGLRRTGIAVLLTALSVILGRGDLPDEARISVLSHLEGRRGPEVITFLQEWVANTTAEDGGAVHAEAQALLMRLAE